MSLGRSFFLVLFLFVAALPFSDKSEAVGQNPFCNTYGTDAGAGHQCNTYSTQYVSSGALQGTCYDDSICKPNDLSSCNARCLYESSFFPASSPTGGGVCTDGSGNSGTCSCGATINSAGYTQASCNPQSLSCTFTAPANGFLTCNWAPGAKKYLCSDSVTSACGTPSPAPSSTVLQNTSGGSCSGTNPGNYSISYACFTARTTIDSPEGPVGISDIKIGQAVWSMNMKSGQIEIGFVTNKFKHSQRPYQILEVKDGNYLEVTSNHPVYDATQKKFVEVAELNSESKIFSRSEKQVSTYSIVRTSDFGWIDDVYNIEVEPNHNYFAKGILVHNKKVNPPVLTSTLFPNSPQPETLTSCSPSCNSGLPPVGNTCAASAPSCPNWTGSAWINPNRPLVANDCKTQPSSSGGFWPDPSFLDPWKVCNACNLTSNCATGCTGGLGGGASYSTAPTSCTCPAQTSPEFSYMSASNQAICCAGPSAPPTPTPVAPPTACDYSLGGSGRQCSGTGQSTCCSGYECQLVGNQPLKLFPNDSRNNCANGDPTCIVPIYWLNNYQSSGTDSLLSTVPVTSSTTPPTPIFTGGNAMCVKTMNTAQNPSSPLTANQIFPPKSITSMIKHEVVTWDPINKYLVCNLQADDRHRVRSSTVAYNKSTLIDPLTNISQGCACVQGPILKYEPVLLPIAQYINYAYEINSGSPRLNQLWASVMESLELSPQLKQIVKKTVTEISHAVPSAWAIIGSCQPGGINGTGVGGAIQSGDPCDSYNVSRPVPVVTGTCTTGYGAPSFACNPNGNLDGKNCSKWCLLSSDAHGIRDNPPGIACNTSAGNPGTCTCGLYGSNNNYYPSSTCTPTACTLTASSCTGATPNFNSSTCTCGPLAKPIYLDTANQWVNTTPLYDINSTQAYGGSKIPTQNTDVVACLRECPASTTRNPASGDVTMCKCNAPNEIFDPVSWKCKKCAKNSILVGGQCVCPYNYEVVPAVGPGQECLPKLPSAEFTRSAAGYPVCGATSNAQIARLPVSYGFNISSAATQVEPNTSTAPGGGQSAVQTILGEPTKNTYFYSTLNTINGTDYPDYFYSQSPHCACTNHVYSPSGLVSNPSTSIASFYGDTSDFINAFNSDGSPAKTYGMVSIAMDGVSDGRLSALATTGGSVCACPNINEVPTSVSGLSGPICIPGIAPKNRVLAVFDPNIDDVPSKSVVMNRSSVSGYSEVLNSADTALVKPVVKFISLPNSQSSPKTLTTYQRHIWKCQLGYNLSLSPPECTINYALNHACDSSSPIATTPASLTFGNVINKKLACCMNSMPVTPNPTTGDVKFDCLETKTTDQADFNTLWASSDDAVDGGQMNALLLTNGAGKPITGFFTVDGARCNEFSEFGGALTPGTVNPGVQSGQQLTVSSTSGWQSNGASYPLPSGPGFSALVSQLQSKGRAAAPQPAQGGTQIPLARRCPILVRAAMVAKCPPSLPAPASATSPPSNAPQYTIKDPLTGKLRCAAAATIQVHLRAEQLFQIAGDPPMITLDTIVDQKAAGTIAIDQIIRQKSAGKCLPGMINGSSGCHY